MRDNRQGLACHKAAATSNNFVIATKCERSNDSSCNVALRLINSIFSPSRANVNLNHAQFKTDRGHWVIKLLNHLLGAGTVICGIVKRTVWFAFACNQKVKKNDKREIVVEEGIRSHTIKHMSVSNASGAKTNTSS